MSECICPVRGFLIRKGTDRQLQNQLKKGTNRRLAVPAHYNPVCSRYIMVLGSMHVFKCISSIIYQLTVYFNQHQAQGRKMLDGSYRTDPLEIRGVFAWFPTQKPEWNGENPIAQRFGMGFSQVTALRSNDSAPRRGVYSQ